MTFLPITSLAAAILALLFIILALRVMRLRHLGIGPSVGFNDSERFMRAVRAHANLGEYAPFFLILCALHELQGGNQTILISTTVVFILGRIAHAIGFGFLQTGPWRAVGMIATNVCILALVICNVMLVANVDY